MPDLQCSSRRSHPKEPTRPPRAGVLWHLLMGYLRRSNDLTGISCASGSEREFILKERWYANEEMQAGADCDAAAALPGAGRQVANLNRWRPVPHLVARIQA